MRSVVPCAVKHRTMLFLRLLRNVHSRRFTNVAFAAAEGVKPRPKRRNNKDFSSINAASQNLEKTLKAEIEQLRVQIEHHDILYHAKGAPEIRQVSPDFKYLDHAAMMRYSCHAQRRKL